MSLDKAALESLRRERDSSEERYQEKGRGLSWRWSLIGAVVLLAAIAGWRVFNGAVQVETVTIEAPEGAEGSVLNASGYVVARRLATVSSKVTGRVAEVLFEEGAAVKAGQVLARLDASTVQAEYNVALQSLEASRRSLREIEVRLADARRTRDRNRSLVERKLVAQSVLDTSEAEVAALAARLAASQAEVGVAQSRVQLSKQSLADLEIRAPFSGVVISKDAQPGEMVSPMSAGGGFTRTGVATVVDMDSREVEVDVNEAYINRVTSEQKVECVLDAYPEWKIPGHVISIVPTADRQKATVRVRIGLDQLDPRILPDMGIKVSFLEEQQGAPRRNVPDVPAKAVVHSGDETYVWVVRDGKAEKRVVTAGAAQKGDVVPVLKGLEGGETVIVDPPRRLRAGSTVELKSAK